MKKCFLVAALMIGGFMFQSANAQLRISINANIGSQPVWGPVGYDHAEYYYMPDIDVFYSVPRRQYIYQQRGRWVFSASLPLRHRNYDIYGGYKVVVNEYQPYRNAATYRTRYSSYKNQRGQQSIRDSRESKYFEVRGHPEHNKWKNDRRNDRNNRNDRNDRRRSND